MTGHLLDTDTLIALMRPDRREPVLPRLMACPTGSVVTSMIAVYELFFGAAKSARPLENRRRIDLLLRRVTPLEFMRPDAEAAGTVRARLNALGTPIGPNDVLIAGQALARGFTLVSGNTREFGRVEGLSLENWIGAAH